MRYQDQVVRITQKALDDVIRAAGAVPSDKLEWTVGGVSRSTLSQMQEIAMSGSWFIPIVRDRSVPQMDEHARKEAARLRQSYDTVEKCVEAAKEGTAELCNAISEFPDGSLEDEITLPFGGGSVMTMADVMFLHAWNMIYHLGQINQIQLALGDREMH